MIKRNPAGWSRRYYGACRILGFLGIKAVGVVLITHQVLGVPGNPDHSNVFVVFTELGFWGFATQHQPRLRNDKPQDFYSWFQ